jgi:RNA polymerase sigma-70 factor (ECF subfamily)
MEPVFDLSTLISQGKIGDLRALHTLYNIYAPPIRRYCYQRLNHRGQAEQCVQATFVQAWQNILTFEYRSDSLFAAWLYTIANNVLSQHQQRQRVTLNSLQSQQAQNSTAVVDVHGVRDQQAMLAQALNLLSVEQQHVITLKFFAGLSTRDIATAINRSEGAVKVIQRRAIHQLYQLTM